MPLEDYYEKRNFEETPEPKGKTAHTKGALHFVVQKHAASHLHYDFRLEAEGVLKSWAILKGPSMNPADKRLAVQVEDHPYDYRTFEGTIPAGNYGAGTVMVWDEGTYHAVGVQSRKESEEEIMRGLEEGRLDFVMNGHKLKGEFSLVRLKGSRKKEWLLIKKKDPHATTEEITQLDKSVLTQRSFSSNLQGIKKKAMPKKIKPMLATLVEEPFDEKDWIFEIKWDGYRALAEIQKGKVQLLSRNNQSFNTRFKPIVKALESFSFSALLDGEIVLLDEKGIPSFQLIQNYQRLAQGQLKYYVFDLLYLEGYDLRHLPLVQRKDLLKKILPESEIIHYCEHVEAKGISYFQEASEKGLEGIIAKKATSLYQQGRSREWLKIKTHKRQEVVVCGFTEPKGTRTYFGALILGVYDQGKLVYVGHTGSGFDRKKLASIYEQLTPLIQKEPSFQEVPKTNAPVTWIQPKLVCEVNFAEWTRDGQMRQPIFLEFREDKKAEEVVRERTMAVEEVLAAKKSSSKSKLNPPSHSPLKLTHPDKIYWPNEGYTKGDLFEYYRQIAPYILPYLKDRPETLVRYPNGIDKPSFFQKEAGKVPEWIRTETVKHEDRTVRYVLVEDENSLLYLANLGCIGMNPFNSRIQSLDYPDYLILDLDPEDVPFEAVIETAQVIHRLLKKLAIPNVCKTSGATGLHVFIPLGAQYTHEQAKHLAHLLARLVHQELPSLTSLERHPHQRQQRVYIDFLQNNFAQTVASVYSVRAKPGATVSTPLKWSEVKPGLHPADFTIKTVPKRLKKLGDLFEPILGPGIQIPSLIQKIGHLFNPLI
jgi:bifunctional non-homologous end joining protein LigD